MISKPPLVSVIIPAYNYARYLPAAVESILRQTYRSVETLIVDDGSTDDTATVARAFGAKVAYHYQPNAGLSAARNTGLRLARGEFIQFLDADDLLGTVDVIERRADLLLKRPELSAAICANRVFSRDFELWLPACRNPWSLPSPAAMDLRICRWNIAPVHAFMVRRSAVEDLGLRFDESMRACEDYDFWFRLAAARGLPAIVRGCHVLYRRHGASMSQKAENQLRHDASMTRRVFAALSQGPKFQRRPALNYFVANLSASIAALVGLSRLGATGCEAYWREHVLPLCCAVLACDPTTLQRPALRFELADIRAGFRELRSDDRRGDREGFSSLETTEAVEGHLQIAHRKPLFLGVAGLELRQSFRAAKRDAEFYWPARR